MPELPEVETVVRDLRSGGLPGRSIRRVVVYWPRLVEGAEPRDFVRRLCGRRVLRVDRRGKFIVVAFSEGPILLIHLRMTGQMGFVAERAHRGAHEHLRLYLDDGRALVYRDSRKFGRWRLVSDPRDALDRLGPEPLDIPLVSFVDRLAGRRAMLKPLLLDQTFLAGMGNIYVDEALWDARLHPRRSSSTLTHAEARRLYLGIRRVLRRGIAALGTTLGRGIGNFYSVSGRRGRNQDRLRVFRRTGVPCPRCGTSIVRLVVSQRGTHVCPACQRAPRSERGGVGRAADGRVSAAAVSASRGAG